MSLPFSHELLQEALTWRWSGEEIFYGGQKTQVRRIESIVHELCHLAVFGRKNFPYDRDIGAEVQRRYGRYRNDFASDISELKTLIVERFVLDALEIFDINWNRVIKLSSLRGEWPIQRRLEKIIELDIRFQENLQAKAKQVRAWIDMAIVLYKIEKGPHPVIGEGPRIDSAGLYGQVRG